MMQLKGGHQEQDRGRRERTRWIMVAVLAALLLVSGCGASASQSGSVDQSGSIDYTAPQSYGPQQYGGNYAGGTASGDTQAGAQFAQWVLQQDPQHQYITEAIVRKEQSLGVKVQPNVTKADVARLLQALTQGMARTFPGKPLTVIAFYQSGDKLAQANYDPATNRVNVQFAQ